MTDDKRHALMHAHLRAQDQADEYNVLASMADSPEEAAAYERMEWTLREQADELYAMATEPVPTHEDGDEPTVAVDGDTLMAVFDNRGVPDSQRKRKWTVRGGRIKETRKIGFLFHHTRVAKVVKGELVSAGFGASAQLVRQYEERIAAGDRSPMVEGMQGFGNEHPDITPEQWSRAHALAHRYKDQSYHALTAKNSVLYVNQRFERRTWHGDGANDNYLGHAYDSDLRYDTFDPDEVFLDIATLKDIGDDEGHPLTQLSCHCCWTNKPHDPGKLYVEFLLDRVAPALRLQYDLDFKTNGGRSLREVLAGD